MIRRPPRSTLFPTRRSSDLEETARAPAGGARAGRRRPGRGRRAAARPEGSTRGSRRSEEHTSELQSQSNLVCRLLLEKKKINTSEECNDRSDCNFALHICAI